MDTPSRLMHQGSRKLLARILDQPRLAEQVQSLPPAVLRKLIDRIGLHDAGELVALATTEQLAQVFDEDLWSNERPGEQEHFDADRFLDWLEVMMEAGERFVAKALVELPEDMVTLALHKHVLVLNIDALALEMQGADEVDARLLDKALESCMYEEMGEYQVMARKPDGWDTILASLLSLDTNHHDVLWRILDRCCQMTSDYVDENGGLYDVLTSEEMLESDVAGDREDRRAARGFVAPLTAVSFLKLARSGANDDYGAHDPVTRSYFRDLSQVPAVRTPNGAVARPDPLMTVLQDDDFSEHVATSLLLATGGAKAKTTAEPLLIQAMRSLGDCEPSLFDARSEELAYLANVLVSGCTFQMRRLRPVEALHAVIATCSLGLWLSMDAKASKKVGRATVDGAADLLKRCPADGLFRLAWHRLHRHVQVPAAELCVGWLERALARAQRSDRPALAEAQSALRKAVGGAAPWKALGHLDALIDVVEAPELDALRGLVDECPHLAGALQPGARAHGAGGVELIGTQVQLAKVRLVLERWQGHRT